MNPLTLASGSKAKPQDPTGRNFLSGREPVSEAKRRRADSSTYVWSLVVTGCLSAAFINSLFSRLPESHTLSWITILLLSIRDIAIATVAGVVGTSIPWLFLKPKPSFSLGSLAKIVAIAWIFFPCITLFYRRQSPLMFLVVTLTAIASAFSLRRLFPAHAEPNHRKLPPWYASDLPSLYGLPIANFRPLQAFSIAICAQGALLLAIADRPFFANVLLSIGLSLLVWRWSALDASAVEQFAGSRQSILLCALALFFTVLALIPWVATAPHGRNAASLKPVLAARKPMELDKPGTEYIGIILWPPPAKKTEIIPPHVHSFAMGAAPKPIVIPFDGPYWYFKAPSQRPGPRAHIAHGNATDVSISSSDSAPLLMEAHQNLGSSIDLTCCSEIDLTIINADNRPGKIAIGLRLTDSSSIGKPTENLGERTILSSQAVSIPINRSPMKETLRFPISRSATLPRFDAITIAFLPAKERSRGGAKVSIQSFTLIPR
ncbi:MAG TPA: hypothetical protein VK684_08460 [Edaphobacter sp.]|nr:hypothetical protein [Edaphobacter sp.]